MVIQSHSVNASSQRTYFSVTMFATGTQMARVQGREEETKDREFRDALTKAKDERDGNGEKTNGAMKASSKSRAGRDYGQKVPQNPWELRLSLAQLIYEWLYGKGTKYGQSFQNESGFGGTFGVSNGTAVGGVNSARVEMFRYERETITYSAQGVINTADGRTINVDINMSMSREFASYMGFSSETTLTDPLVINYAGTVASLMGDKFEFDLTTDGNPENISMLAEGNGFLALDLNGDGRINDGSELFGPRTGCGFSELRKYDADGNGWIDANDEIFDKLLVWSRNIDGSDTIRTLRELNIGAIFLGDIATEFTFMGENNETLGVMRSTSFFIKECGGTGTLSHIDLAS